jgi:hypothetical protein
VPCGHVEKKIRLAPRRRGGVAKGELHGNLLAAGPVSSPGPFPAWLVFVCAISFVAVQTIYSFSLTI